MVENKIWYKDIKTFLVDEVTIIEVIPEKTMSLERQLNAVFRFSLFFAIFVFLFRRDYRIIYFPIIIGCLTYLIYSSKVSTDADKLELFDKLNITDTGKKVCYKPTVDNPFMNVSLVDRQDFPNRPEACKLSNKSVKDDVQKILDDQTICNVDDIFQRNTGFRSFYTNPSTTIPNEQDKFSKWLFNMPPTCKERTMSCTSRKI